MRIDVHHYVHQSSDPATSALLARIEAKIDALTTKESQEMIDLAQLTQTVTDMRGTVNSANAALNAIHQALLDALALGDPAAIQAQVQQLTDQLGQEKADLAAGIAANPLPTPPTP